MWYIQVILVWIYSLIIPTIYLLVVSALVTTWLVWFFYSYFLIPSCLFYHGVFVLWNGDSLYEWPLYSTSIMNKLWNGFYPYGNVDDVKLLLSHQHVHRNSDSGCICVIAALLNMASGVCLGNAVSPGPQWMGFCVNNSLTFSSHEASYFN